MDTLTHALSGALLARATESPEKLEKELPRRQRMWVGALAAAFPDSDFVLRFIDPLTYLTAHRGLTHSLLLLPLWALCLAFVFAFLFRRRYPWQSFVALSALGIAAHIAGDIITSFGTMVFAPLSDMRVALPFTFIIDLYFSGIIVIGLLGSLAWKSSRLPAATALVVLVAYIGAQGWLHYRALGIAEEYAAHHPLVEPKPYALPQPFSPFHWMVVVADASAYHITYVTLSRRETLTLDTNASWWRRLYASYAPVDKASWTRVPRFSDESNEASLAHDAWQSPALARYRHFALLPALYRIDTRGSSHCVWFNDLRFAMAERDMPFRYGACRDTTTEWKVYSLTDNPLS